MKIELTEIEKQQAKELLDELDEQKGPEGLADWNIRAQTLLVFIACRKAEAFFQEI